MIELLKISNLTLIAIHNHSFFPKFNIEVDKNLEDNKKLQKFGAKFEVVGKSRKVPAN